MKLYIAAHSQEAAASLMQALQSRGHKVTSRWILADKKFNQGIKAYTDAERTAITIMDEEDVRTAIDGLVLLAEGPGKMVPGGKHVETGIALALGRDVFVIGRRENIFHWHPRVQLFDSIQEFLEKIDAQMIQSKAS